MHSQLGEKNLAPEMPNMISIICIFLCFGFCALNTDFTSQSARISIRNGRIINGSRKIKAIGYIGRRIKAI